MFYLTTHSSYFINGYNCVGHYFIVKDHSNSHYTGNRLYEPYYSQDSTYHETYYISREALSGTEWSAFHTEKEEKKMLKNFKNIIY